MSTSVKNANTQALSGNVSSTSSELMARLSAQSRASEGLGAQKDFSGWMAQHGQDMATKPDAKPAQATSPAKSEANQAEQTAAERGLTNARLNEQAMTRARQQAMAAQRQAEQARLNEASAGARKDKPAATTAKSEGEKPAEAEAKVEDKEKQPADAAPTALTADAKQAATPQDAAPTDKSGMMALLASLNHAGAKAGQTGGDALSDASEAAQKRDLLQGGDVTQAQSDRVGASNNGTHGLDPQLWQSVQSTAALQVDAMLSQAGAVGERKADVDTLSGLMASGAMRAPTPGLGGADAATSGVRHESATLGVPFGSTDFAQALAEKVSMWVSSARSDGPMTAELHLNPAEMGPINVKISLDGDSAQVDFAAAAVETRQAIEASMSMLSSSLSDVGLTLTGGDVSAQTSQQSFAQQWGQSESGSRSANAQTSGSRDLAESDEGLSMRQVAAPRPGRVGGLDLYA